jgi:hypothetical protein
VDSNLGGLSPDAAAIVQGALGGQSADAGFVDPMEGVDREALAADTVKKREQMRADRKIHEQEWFINAAMVRGNQYVEWDNRSQRLNVPKAAPHRVRLKIPRLQAKVRARIAKFTKNRPKPIVVPATTEYQDYQNAKATQKVLDYLWRKCRLEQKYKDSIQWAMICGKAFWWFHWNEGAQGRVQEIDPQTGMKSYSDRPLGDVEVEVGSPFEVLVADPGADCLEDQPEIMRIRMRKVKDMQARYSAYAAEITPSNKEESYFAYERQIAGLNPHTFSSGKVKDNADEVLVTEHFIAPCAEYPKGEYRVLCGDVLVKYVPELPYGFHDQPNPYPVIEFYDFKVPGQFWCPTICAQMVDLQREYNLLRSKLAENLRVMAHPKIIVAKQHQLPKTSWTSDAGEIIEYIAIPNIPPPQPWFPPNVASDLWKAIELIQKEFDDISQIFPAAEGKAGQATSGFQTNLLQEATDTVHAPDIRQAELSVEAGCYKLRRMVKLGYDIPRLINAVGMDYAPEIFEFSGDQIDDLADIIVEVGSALPTLKAAKQEAVMNLFNGGLLGDPADPSVRQRALGLLEMGALEETFDIIKADERQARMENKALLEGQPPPNPHFWENHQVHYTEHTLLMKSPSWQSLGEAVRRAHVVHTVLHARFINPQSAMQIALEEGLMEVMPLIQGMLAPMGGQAPIPGPPPAGPPPPNQAG